MPLSWWNLSSDCLLCLPWHAACCAALQKAQAAPGGKALSYWLAGTPLALQSNPLRHYNPHRSASCCRSMASL